jgi:hypothetical protein
MVGWHWLLHTWLLLCNWLSRMQERRLIKGIPPLQISRLLGLLLLLRLGLLLLLLRRQRWLRLGLLLLLLRLLPRSINRRIATLGL